jgi:hypothetical protein
MKHNIKSFFNRILQDQNAQVLPMVAVLMIGFMGMAAMVGDVGDVYYSYSQLQASTNAAVMAAAQGLPFSTSTNNQALTNAEQYSSESATKTLPAGFNAFSNLNITNTSVNFACLSTGLGASVPCVTAGNQSANVVQVKQTAQVKTYFAALFGTSSVTLTATATALMRGEPTVPYNVAIIVDTTDSMTSNRDSNCGNVTRLQCALNGVQTLLSGLLPCVASGCGSLSSQSFANSLDRVALFSFPNVLQSTVADQYDCSNSSPTPEMYTFPVPGASTLSPVSITTTTTGRNGTTTVTNLATYETTSGLGGTDSNGFVSDFRSSDSSSGLSSSSDIVEAVGGKSGCSGMSGPGGEGTYYAGAIFAAQSALTSEQAAFPNSQNIMILVSDGAATASNQQMYTTAPSSGALFAASSPSKASFPQYGYPSTVNECEQAVLAANYARSQGTTVYAVAYGSPSTGCTTDTASGGITSPCTTMADIGGGSGSATFYSDDNQSGTTSNCPAGKSVSSISEIFDQILSNLSAARLIPNSVFPSS